MKKACFIIPYFGRFPVHFPLWLHSAGKQEEYDFYFLTDIAYDRARPENVKLVHMTLGDIAQRVRDVLGIEPALKDAYKLCDFKPAYGLLFPEIVEPYPFWGFIDVDIILGNMAHFLTEELFAKFDKIGVQGHMTLMRNCEKVNRLFMTDTGGRFIDYKTVFQDGYCFHFDENDLCAHSDEYGVSFCVFPNYWDVTPWKFPFLWRISADRFGPAVFRYENGDLYMDRLLDEEIQTVEMMYVHFQKRSMSVEPNLDYDRYLAIPNSFVPYRDITPDFICRVNKNRFYWEWHKRRFKMIVYNIRNGAIKHRLKRKRG